MYCIHLGSFIRICDKPLPLKPENLFKNYRVMDKWQHMHIDYQIIIFLLKSKFRNQNLEALLESCLQLELKVLGYLNA